MSLLFIPILLTFFPDAEAANCSQFITNEDLTRLKSAIAKHDDWEELTAISERFMVIPISRTTSDPKIIKDKYEIKDLLSVEAELTNIEFKYIENSPTLVRLSPAGLHILSLNRFTDKVEFIGPELSFRSPVGFVHPAKIGPAHLNIHKNSDGSTNIFYTDAKYIFAMKFHSNGEISELMHDHFGRGLKGWIQKVYPIDVKLFGSEIKRLYAAETSDSEVGIFTMDREGRPYFLNNRTQLIDRDLRQLAKELNAHLIRSISDLINMPNVKVFGLTKDHLYYFDGGNKALLTKGMRYHYLLEPTGTDI
jgi:hypothetical protein